MHALRMFLGMCSHKKREQMKDKKTLGAEILVQENGKRNLGSYLGTILRKNQWTLKQEHRELQKGG